MLVIQLCLLLLPFGVSSAVSAKPNNKFTCAVTKANDADDLRKCVAKDLLLGWLYVINKTSVRLDEVRKNATAMAEGAKELRKEANAALNSAANVLIGLGSNSNEALGVKEIMKNISDAITWVNESERNASEAADVTDITEGLTEVGYAAISRVHWYFRDKFKYVQEHWADKGPSEVVETIFPATLQCPNMINVSKTLSDYADKLDDSTIRLDAWRVEMLKKIQTTHNDTQGNGTTCHSIFNNRDRMHEVMGAVANLSDRLIVVVRKLHAALLVREKARANVDAANENMKTMTTSMLNSLKQNGTALCEMLRQHAAIRSKLSEAYRKLEEVSGRVSNNLASATNTEKTAAARSVLVHSVLKEVEGLSRSTILFNSAESPTLRNATQANEK
ncbi:hypothetical protein, conserved in T. vivax [Trypanosoma vivax Y486]|uniref:Uncharacterized protein n=1 Tax=Trypanosoma vivax (strain Y486) TaxID=1055687 RepID=F9WP23_TRYVY|nr:hypothetical protein, conserved in T. vivax [Trypanosoma vivax Y486]|eukprot:CCD19297.1 hypothetical protein, conserved in T. vivax [Trypanosoma vivax Y486]